MTESEAVTTPTIRDGNVTAWFEDIGPARAEQLLRSYEVDYRKFRPTYAEGLARDMANNHWLFDGSPVKIDVKGKLFDGQHRLNAIISSRTTQSFLVISGLPVEAYNTTDTGLARNYADSLRRRGYTNVAARQAVVKLIWRYLSGKSYDDTKRRTTSEMDEIHDKWVSEINRAVELAYGVHRKIHMPLSLITLSWFVFRELDEEKATTFMAGLAEGEHMGKGNPIYTLRERLLRDKDIKYSRNEYMHLVFAAWNAWVEGRELNTIPLPSGLVTRAKMMEPLDPKVVKTRSE